jgi:hypothetical protein
LSFKSAAFRNFEHRFAEIQSGDFRAALREGECDVTRPAAQIERTVSGSHSGEFYNMAFPAPMETKALDVVEQILAPCDRGKKVIDLRSALFTRNVEGVAHGANLAD